MNILQAMKSTVLVAVMMMVFLGSMPSHEQAAPAPTKAANSQVAGFYGLYCFEASGTNQCCTTSWWGLSDSCAGQAFSLKKKRKKTLWLADVVKPYQKHRRS
jgi:invasion protein IalB